jgi:hypothetical protein
MSVKCTPARRRADSITTIPATVTLSFDAPLNHDGSRLIPDEDLEVLEGILDPQMRLGPQTITAGTFTLTMPTSATFADRVAPQAALCRRIIELHGGGDRMAPREQSNCRHYECQ